MRKEGTTFDGIFHPHAKEAAIGRIVPEDAHARHLLIERAHVVHLGCPFLISELSHSKFFHSPPTFPSTENTPAPAFPVQEIGLGAGFTHARVGLMYKYTHTFRQIHTSNLHKGTNLYKI